MKTMSRLGISSIIALLVVGGATLPANAEEVKLAVNPTGTWKLTVVSTNQASATERILKLKLEGNTLTGTLTYNASAIINGKAKVAERPITEAKLQGEDISFNFTHPPATGNAANANYTYHGKITGDLIKGDFVTEWMGSSRTRQWKAERQKP